MKYAKTYAIPFYLGATMSCAPVAEEVGQGAQGLHGTLTTVSCTPAQTTILTDAHQAGMQISMTEDFGACLRRRVMQDYLPCLDGDTDPYTTESRDDQYGYALAKMRSANTDPLTITCGDLSPGVNASAGIERYDYHDEQMIFRREYLDSSISLSSGRMVDMYELSDFAGTIWHEAMHQHGYQHPGAETEEDVTRCGYPAASYTRGGSSMPYIADRCMRSAGIAGRVIAWGLDGRGWSLPIGRNAATSTTEWNNRVAVFRLPPASEARFCTDVRSGAGVGTCVTYTNATTEYGPRTTLGSDLRLQASWVEVTPLALGYAQTDYTGSVVQAFRYGEHLANAGALSVVGNDRVRSLYIAPGMRVRACAHEGGTGGHGQGPCRVFDGSTPDTASVPGISYLDVIPAVTVFTEESFRGTRRSLSPGLWSGAAGLGASHQRVWSIVVPNGLYARLCAGRTCADYSVSSLLKSTTASAATTVFVGPVQNPRVLTVTRPTSAGTGSVVSLPSGIACGSTCTASFQDRATVRFTATPQAGYHAVWSGCDDTPNGVCEVTMLSARTISVRFDANTPCYEACFDACVSGGGLYSQCVSTCQGRCPNG